MRARNQVMAENIKTYATQYVTQHLNLKYFFESWGEEHRIY
jgi:hypothetical protein